MTTITKKTNLKMNHEKIAGLGNKLFHFRRWFYLIPVLFLMLMEPKEFSFHNHAIEEVYESLGIAIAFLGISIRFWASGSSRRNVLRKGRKRFSSFETKGIFSVVRNPYFLGDFFIVLGLSIPLFKLHLIFLSLLLFVGLSIPQVLSREQALLNQFRDAYEVYLKKTRLILPSLKNWCKNQASFSWRGAFLKEGNVFVSVGILFFFMEQFIDFRIEGELDMNAGWILFMLLFVFVFIMLRIFDPGTRNMFTDSIDFPD